MENNDMLSVSAPLAAGTMTAALISSGWHDPSCPELLAAAFCSSLAMLCLLAACVLDSGRCSWVIPALFFFIGASGMLDCRMASARSGNGPVAKLAGQALEGFQNLIENAGFRNSDTTALVSALLTGRRDMLGREEVAAFRAAGASHILALSGLHLGVIYAILGRFLRPLGMTPAAKFIRSSILIAVCGMYALVTGASPSMVRAFLFIVLNELSKALSGRRHSPQGTFCIALTVQLVMNPAVIESVGFQLSYLAMLGIITIFPKISGWYEQLGPTARWDLMRKVWDSAALSTSCQLFTAPLVWLKFRSFPKYYLLTNLLALPLTEGIIFSALLCILLSLTGKCPSLPAAVTDTLVSMLERCLRVISSM